MSTSSGSDRMIRRHRLMISDIEIDGTTFKKYNYLFDDVTGLYLISLIRGIDENPERNNASVCQASSVQFEDETVIIPGRDLGFIHLIKDESSDKEFIEWNVWDGDEIPEAGSEVNLLTYLPEFIQLAIKGETSHKPFEKVITTGYDIYSCT